MCGPAPTSLPFTVSQAATASRDPNMHCVAEDSPTGSQLSDGHTAPLLPSLKCAGFRAATRKEASSSRLAAPPGGRESGLAVPSQRMSAWPGRLISCAAKMPLRICESRIAETASDKALNGRSWSGEWGGESVENQWRDAYNSGISKVESQPVTRCPAPPTARAVLQWPTCHSCRTA